MTAAFDLHNRSMHHCFPPVIREDTRLLVLGSLPGRASLAAGRYYAHPRNLFWRLIGGVIGREIEALDYQQRLAALLDARVGLWDTVDSAMRRGSLDADIRLNEASDLLALIATLPELRAIAFNGTTAAKIGRRELGQRPGLTLIDLPSSSPAYASLPYARKAEIWRTLSAFLQ
jgi:hypoxanthine-DNA glycosylase